MIVPGLAFCEGGSGKEWVAGGVKTGATENETMRCKAADCGTRRDRNDPNRQR